MRQSVVILLLLAPAIGAGQTEFFRQHHPGRGPARCRRSIVMVPSSLVMVWNSENHAGPGSQGESSFVA